MKNELSEIAHDNKKKIFMEVVKSNLDGFRNGTINSITDFFSNNYINHLTNDEVRKLAVAFFAKELSKRVLELNDSIIFQLKNNYK
ncbi:hypothetical protein [Tenacibaculum maritimum]|uniref:hypothetical protein n=1 Tax=Tenacibaculum maritimum TaxID=107401 RepID=UPI003876F42D